MMIGWHRVYERHTILNIAATSV